MNLEYKHVTLWLAGAMLVLGGLYYFFVHRHMKKSPESKVQSPILSPRGYGGQAKVRNSFHAYFRAPIARSRERSVRAILFFLIRFAAD